MIRSIEWQPRDFGFKAEFERHAVSFGVIVTIGVLGLLSVWVV